MINKNIFKAICTISAASIFSACNSGEKVSLMFQGQENRYFLEVRGKSESQWGSEPMTERPVGVLIGGYNVVKSTIMNGICGTNLKTSDKGKGNTKFIYKSQSLYNGFDLYDVPGLGEEYAIEDLVQIFSATTSRPINVIFLVISGHQNNKNIYRDFKDVVLPMCDGTISVNLTNSGVLNKKVHDILSKIVIIFSRYDEIIKRKDTNVNEKINNSMLAFANEDIKYECIFYGSPEKAVDPEAYDKCFHNLSKLMYELMSKRRSTKLEIDLSGFIKYSDCFNPESKVQKALTFFKDNIGLSLVTEYKDYFEKISKDFEEKRKKNEPSEDTEENLYAEFLILFEKEIQEKADTFAKTCELLHSIQREDSRELYFFKSKLLDYCTTLQDSLLGKLKSSVQKYFYDSTDIRNLMRKCKHCGLVWVKVEGCSDNTYCGERPSYYNDRLTEFGRDEKKLLNEFATYTVGRTEHGLLFHVRNKDKKKSLNDKAIQNKLKDYREKKSYYYNHYDIGHDNKYQLKKIYVDLSPKDEEEVEKGAGTANLLINGEFREVNISRTIGCNARIDWKKDTESLKDHEIMECLGVDSMERAKDFFNFENRKEPKENEMIPNEIQLEVYKNINKEKLEIVKNETDTTVYDPTAEKNLKRNM